MVAKGHAGGSSVPREGAAEIQLPRLLQRRWAWGGRGESGGHPDPGPPHSTLGTPLDPQTSPRPQRPPQASWHRPAPPPQLSGNPHGPPLIPCTP